MDSSRWHQRPRAARIDQRVMKSDVIAFLKASTSPTEDGAVAIGMIRDFFEENAPDKTPTQRANSVNNAQNTISRALEKDAEMLRADWKEDMEKRVSPHCLSEGDRSLYARLLEMPMDEFFKHIRKAGFDSVTASREWLALHPYKPILYAFEHPREERAIATQHKHKRVMEDNDQPKALDPRAVELIDDSCVNTIKRAVMMDRPMSQKPQEVRQFLWKLVNAIMAMIGRRPCEILRGGPEFIVEGRYLLSVEWGKKQGAHTHGYQFPCRMDAGTVVRAIEIVRNTPLPGYKGGYLKEDSVGRQNSASDLFCGDIDFKMYALVRGYYVVRAYSEREKLGFCARPITLNAFAMRALGHQEMQTNMHYTKVVIEDEEKVESSSPAKKQKV